MSEEYGHWECYRACTRCDEALSEHVVYYANGVCPHCGNDAGSTICSHKKIIRRKFYTDARQLAHRAQKLRKANVLTRFLARLGSALRAAATPRERQPERPFTWEVMDS